MKSKMDRYVDDVQLAVRHPSADPFREPTIRIYFSTKQGIKLPVDIDRNSTVRELEGKILQTLQFHKLHEADVAAQLKRGCSLQLSLGGEILELNKSLRSYSFENGSVVHPKWGSIRAALEFNDGLAWLDPDWHEESHRRNSRAAHDFLNRLCASPSTTIGSIFWPGPLVPHDIHRRRKASRPAATSAAIDEDDTSAAAPSTSSRRGELLVL